MVKLFAGLDLSGKTYSAEEFRSYYGSSTVISLESISDYFYKMKDSFASLASVILKTENDKVVSEVLSNQREVEHVSRRIKFINFRNETIAMPENFKGKFVDLSTDLVATASILIPDVEQSLANLKLAVSSFINEYSENKVSTIYGISYFKEAEKLTINSRKEIGKYFPSSNSAVKSHAGDVLKTMFDVEHLFKDVKKLDGVINLDKIKRLNSISSEVSELVDLLIEQNTKSSILLRNNSTKKELINAIYIVAKEIELASYLYSNCIFLYTSVKSLSDKVLEVGNREEQ